jgi:hypothetical protein
LVKVNGVRCWCCEFTIDDPSCAYARRIVLICGEQLLNYRTVCRIPFGAYAQVHDDQSITNTMSSRTTGAISLGSVNNVQGTYRFLSLRTGEIVVRRTWTELPVPSEVIDRVTELTLNETDYVDYQNELDELDQEDELDILDQCEHTCSGALVGTSQGT